MKKIIVILFLLVCGFGQQSNNNDIVPIYDYGTIHINENQYLYFSRWHDKQSGVEFICVQNSRWNNDASVSCFTTGRKW